MSGRGMPLKVFVFTIEYIAMSPKTTVSPSCSSSAKVYVPMTSPLRQVGPPKR